MEAISAVGANAMQMKGGFELGLPVEAQFAILLLSLACAAWMLALVLPPPARWRDALGGVMRRLGGRRGLLSGVAGR